MNTSNGITLKNKAILSVAYNDWNLKNLVALRDDLFSEHTLVVYGLKQPRHPYPNLIFKKFSSRLCLTTHLILGSKNNCILVQFLAHDIVIWLLKKIRRFRQIIHIDDGTMFLNSHLGGLLKLEKNSVFEKLIGRLKQGLKINYLELRDVDRSYLFNLDLYHDSFGFKENRTFSQNERIVKYVQKNLSSQSDYLWKDLGIPIVFGTALVEHRYCSVGQYKKWLLAITDGFSEYLYVAHPSEVNLALKLTGKATLYSGRLSSEEIISLSSSKEFLCFGSTATFIFANVFLKKKFTVNLVQELAVKSLLEKLKKSKNIKVKFLKNEC